MTPVLASTGEIFPQKVKLLLHGWSHAIAVAASLAFIIMLGWLSHTDLPRMISLLIFGLSMMELYTVSAIYHIITWKPAKRRVLRAMDHANTLC